MRFPRMKLYTQITSHENPKPKPPIIPLYHATTKFKEYSALHYGEEVWISKLVLKPEYGNSPHKKFQNPYLEI